MPIGREREGFFTSSAIEATLVTPAYETNTKPVAASTPLMPSGAKGVNAAVSVVEAPPITMKPSTPRTAATMIVWNRPETLTPVELSAVSNTARPTPIHSTGMSTKKSR